MSKDEQLTSPSGAPIFKYNDGEKEWESPSGEMSLEQISDHIEKYIGEIDMVYHELLSDTVHIDVHHVKPSKNRNYHTLVTSGMSDLPMNVPYEVDSSRYMELVMFLPEYWQISDAAFEDEKWYWPVRQLKYLARFPHKYDSWFGWGHSIPNGNPSEPFAQNTKLSGVILLPPVSAPNGFLELKIHEHKTIYFYCIVPLYDEEMELKLNKGTDLLLTKFDKYDISDLVSINRKNVAKKLFGLF